MAKLMSHIKYVYKYYMRCAEIVCNIQSYIMWLNTMQYNRTCNDGVS